MRAPGQLVLPARVVVAVLAALLLAVPAAAAAPSADTAVPGHGRAWELVTPPDRNGAPLQSVAGIDAGGEHVVYTTWGPQSGAPTGALSAYAYAARGPGGWSGRPVGYPYTTAALALNTVVPRGVSEDRSTWLWTSPAPLLPGAPSSPQMGLYRAQGQLDGPLTSLGAVGPVSGFDFRALSADGQRVFFMTSADLGGGGAGWTNGRGVYELAGGELRAVGVDDDGNALSSCGTVLGNTSGGGSALPANAVSRDGRRVFVMAPDDDCGGEPRRVYLRQDAGSTIEISASRCSRGDCNAAQDVHFMGATPSGATAFLVTAEQLTDDDTDDSGDLYRYDVDGGVLTRISIGPPGVAADVMPLEVRASADGRRVYFLASGQLEPGSGAIGEPNVYLADRGDVRFVATLAAGDPWPSDGEAPSQLTPDGDRLLFRTKVASGGDSDVHNDLYLYDASDDAVTWLSGGPAGGNGDFDVASALSGVVFQGMVAAGLSTDGRHAFFTTREALVPQDVNGQLDVYEWSDGVVGLVSSGRGDQQTVSGGASADGRSAFFSTNESLVAADRDGGDLDLYAARIGGGFPEVEPPAPTCADLGTCPRPALRRLSRKAPASAAQDAGGRLRVRAPGAAALRRALATGRLVLGVETSARGRVSALARARVSGRLRTVARGGSRASGRGRVRVVLRLSSAARHVLAHGGRLRLTVVVRQPRAGARGNLTVTLGGAR